MEKLRGTLVVEEIIGRRGPFCVGMLHTSIGEFKVTDKELATEVYLASLLAIEVDHFMERGYLDELARALKLDDNLKGSIERQVAQLGAPG